MLGLQLLDGVRCDGTRVSHGHVPTLAPPLYWVSSAWCNVQDPVLVGQKLCKPVTGVLQKGKASPIPTICVDSSNDELLPFPEWKGFSIVNLSSSIWLFLLWDGAILGTWLGIFCWQVRHSSVTVAVSVLVCGSPCFWTCPGYSTYESIVRWMAYYRMWYLR